MNYYLNGEKVTSDELTCAFYLLLNGTYCKQTMEVEKIENNNIYFIVVNHAVK